MPANYMNFIPDPRPAQQNTLNNIMQIKQNQDEQARNAIVDQQNQEARDLRLATVPYEFLKVKSGHIAQIARKIEYLPMSQRITKYGDLVNRIAPEPITTHPTLGPLGSADSSQFLSVDEFAKMPEEDQRKYLNVISYTAEDLSKLEIADRASVQKEEEIRLKAKLAIDQIREAGSQARQTEKLTSQNRMDLEKMRQAPFAPDEPPSGFSQEEIDLMGATYNLKGTLPALGRGKEATALRQAILKSASRQAIESGGTAQDVVAGQADVKAIAGSLNYQEKQFGAMGSFVKNLDAQVGKVNELAQEFATFDTRLLNMPLRAIRGRLAGSPMQAKYDMYLTEIESEIGKLATGSTASVAELSQGAQEKWSRIHDKNLSIKDMLSLLEETREAGRIRMKSVGDQISETRTKMRGLSSAGTMKNQTPAGPGMQPSTGAMPGQGIKTAEDYLRKLRGQ